MPFSMLLTQACQLLQTFESIYSSYCDCGKFIKWVDEPAYKEAQAKAATTSAAVKTEEEEEINVEKMDDDNNNNTTTTTTSSSNEEYAWFISRGAEMCDVEDGVCKYFIVTGGGDR